MNLELSIPVEAETRLYELAAAAGRSVEQFEWDAVAEKLAVTSLASQATTPLSGSAWQREFDALLLAAPRVSHPVDDSRESVYEGRGG